VRRDGLTLLELLLAISLMALVAGAAAAWVRGAGNSLDLHRSATGHARIRHALRQILVDDLLLADDTWKEAAREVEAQSPAVDGDDDATGVPQARALLSYTVLAPRRGHVAVRWHFDRDRGWLWRTAGRGEAARSQVVCGGLASFAFTRAGGALSARYRLREEADGQAQTFGCWREPGHDDESPNGVPR